MASGEDPNRHGATPSPQAWRGSGSPGGTPDMSLDLQLSDMRRSLDVAITKIDGQLTVLLQKSDWAEQRARESAERIAAEFAARDAKQAHLETKMETYEDSFSSLKGRVYFMSGIATAFGGAIGVVTAFLVRH
jgi:VIT1/CCC1 family predicted Fe2+/Mn2+ transporter